MTQPTSREGSPVPNVKFRYRENGEWKEIDTDQLFKGRTVAVFSLPGAFTPTCSSTHLPRFNELAPAFKENKVDQVVCVSKHYARLTREITGWPAEKIVVIPNYVDSDVLADFSEVDAEGLARIVRLIQVL